jgi:hypothetical protein
MPLRVTVLPSTSAEAPSPERVTEHDVPEQETLSEVAEHAPREPRVSQAASRPPAHRTVREAGNMRCS